MFKKILVLVLVSAMMITVTACNNAKNKEYVLPEYESQEFEIAGLWAPNEMSKEAFMLYKEAGFNVLSFTNHDAQPRSSENQYYLGSKRTEEALKLCKEVGLYAYISIR